MNEGLNECKNMLEGKAALGISPLADDDSQCPSLPAYSCWAPLGELSHSGLINYPMGRVPSPTLLIEETTGTERLSHFSGTVQLVGGTAEAWNPGCRP